MLSFFKQPSFEPNRKPGIDFAPKESPATADTVVEVRRAEDEDFQIELAKLPDTIEKYKDEMRGIRIAPFGARELLADDLLKRARAKKNSVDSFMKKMPVFTEKHVKYSAFLETIITDLERLLPRK